MSLLFHIFVSSQTSNNQWHKQHLCGTSLIKSTTHFHLDVEVIYIYPPLPGHMVVGVVVTTDAEAKELAGGALDLEPLDLQGTLQEPVASLKVPVAAPQEMHAADGQEVSGGQPLQEGLELIWMTGGEGGGEQIAKWREVVESECEKREKKEEFMLFIFCLKWRCWVRYFRIIHFCMIK